MGTQKKRGFQGVALNPEGLKPLTDAIGQLINNFAALDLLSMGWLHELSSDKDLVRALSNLRFSRRAELVMSLVELGRAPPEVGVEAGVLWRRAKDLAKLRNVVAHSPFLFGWHGDERPEPPDFAGLPRKGKNLLRLDEVRKAVDETAAIGQKLFDLGNKAWPEEELPQESA